MQIPLNAFVQQYQERNDGKKYSSASNRLIAYSSQHIIAHPSQTKPHTNLTTIRFSFLPVHHSTPTWSFSLPRLNNLDNSTNANTIQTVDYLLFSPDGIHLLVCTKLQLQHVQRLRLSVLTQSNSRADHWSLSWDHLLPPRPIQYNHSTHSLAVSKACFLFEPRRWFTEPAQNQSNISEEQLVSIRSTQYRKLARTPNSSINFFAQGKGQTALLVLSTNELLVIHIPLPQLNLPPHILLTRLDDSAVTPEPLKLVPSPTSTLNQSQQASSDRKAQPPANLHPQQPGLHSLPSNAHQSNPLPPNSTSSYANPPTTSKSSNNPDPPAQNHSFSSSFTDSNMTPNQKQVIMAAIGLPASFGGTSDQQLDQPRILIAFQTKVTPKVPTSIFQTTVIIDGTEDPEAKTPTNQDDFPFASSMGGVDEDIGEFITGLGDLDDAFDVPMVNSTTNESKDLPKIKENGQDEEEESKQASSSMANDRLPDSNQDDSNPKKTSTIETRNKQHIKNHSRRFEPNLGIYDDHSSIGIPSNSSLNDSDLAPLALFIQLVEVNLDFNHPGLLPTVTIQQLPNLPIIDPFDYTKTTQVLLRTLEFISVMPNSSATNRQSKAPLLRLLAGYSRELDPLSPAQKLPSSDTINITWVDELQLWDLRFLHSRLSNAFLAIDCLVDRNQSASSPDLLLRGPPEWMFTRLATKKLTELKSDLDSSVDENRSCLWISNILLNWKVSNECFILIVKQTSDSSASATTPTSEENHVPRKKRKTGQSEIVKYECIVLNSKDLAATAVIPLPASISKHEINQLSLSYHGVWCCSLDEWGKVRASPLITSKDIAVIVSLVVSAIHNREAVDDISRFLNRTISTTKSPELITTINDTDTNIRGSELDHQLIFQHISSFLVYLNPAPRNYDLDHLLSPSWNAGFALWSAIPQYQNAAEIALIGRQLFSALSIGMSVRAEAYSRSIWPMIGTARWYSRLCQRIVSSIDLDSKSAHLCLLATTSCTFYYLFKVAMNIHQFSLWLNMINSSSISAHDHNTHNQGQEDQKGSSVKSTVCLQDEIQIARLVFFDIWDHSNIIHMESWGKLLQDLGRNFFTIKSGIDFTKLSIRHVESFSAPLAATDANQIKESVEMLTGFISNYPQLLKPVATRNSNNNQQRTPTVQPTPATATAAENLADGGAEEERNERRLRRLREINSSINAEEDKKKYDILTGAKLEFSGFHSVLTNQSQRQRPMIKKHWNDAGDALKSNFEKQGLDRMNDVGFDSIKECLKCGSRSSTLSWSYQHDSPNMLNGRENLRHHRDSGIGGIGSCDDGSNSLVIGQFDASIKEFNRVCICGGAWVAPSSA